MGTKRDEAKARTSKEVRMRAEIKSLPKAEEKLGQKEMKKVRGSIVGPCDRERLHR